VPSLDRLERAAGVLALLCVAILVLTQLRPSFTNASRPQNGIPDPVLSLQMAHNVEQVDAVLGEAPSPDREVMRTKQYEDFGFIAGYAALYIVLSILLARSYPHARSIAVLAAISGIATAALDVTENFAILRIVDTSLTAITQSMIDAMHRISLLKWALGFIALGLLSPYFLWERRGGRFRIARGIGVLYAAAAILGLYSIYNHSLLPFAAGLILLGLCGTAVFFLLLPQCARNRPVEAR
jgi:hypothetical protein